MKKQIKVQITFTEGYEERFTKACIAVAKRRVENRTKANIQETQKKVAAAG